MRLIVFALLVLLIAQCSQFFAFGVSGTFLPSAGIEFSPFREGFYTTFKARLDFSTAGMNYQNPNLERQNLRYVNAMDMNVPGIDPGFYAQFAKMEVPSTFGYFNPKYRQLDCAAKFIPAGSTGSAWTKVRVKIIFANPAVPTGPSYTIPLATATETRYSTGNIYLYEPNLQLLVDFIPQDSAIAFNCADDLAITTLTAYKTAPPPASQITFSIPPELFSVPAFSYPVAFASPATHVGLLPKLTATPLAETPHGYYLAEFTYTLSTFKGSLLGKGTDMILYNNFANTNSVARYVEMEGYSSTGIPCYSTTTSKVVGRFFYKYPSRMNMPTINGKPTHLSLINALETCRFTLNILLSDATRLYSLNPQPLREGFYGSNGYSGSAFSPPDLQLAGTDVLLSNLEYLWPLTMQVAIEAEVTSEQQLAGNISLQLNLYFSSKLNSVTGGFLFTPTPSPTPSNPLTISCRVGSSGSWAETTLASTDITLPLDLPAGMSFAHCVITASGTTPLAGTFTISKDSTNFSIPMISSVSYFPVRTTPLVLPIWSPTEQSAVYSNSVNTGSTYLNFTCTATSSIAVKSNLVFSAPSNILFDFVRFVSENTGFSLPSVVTVDPSNPSFIKYVIPFGAPSTSTSWVASIPIVISNGSSALYPINTTPTFTHACLPDIYAHMTQLPDAWVEKSQPSLPSPPTSTPTRFSVHRVAGIDSIWYRHPTQLSSTFDPKSGYQYGETFPQTLYTHLFNAWRLLVTQAMSPHLNTVNDATTLEQIDKGLFFIIRPTSLRRVDANSFGLSIPHDIVDSSSDPHPNMESVQDPRITADIPSRRQRVHGSLPLFEITFGLRSDHVFLNADFENQFIAMKTALEAVFRRVESSAGAFATGASPSGCFDIASYSRVGSNMCFPPLKLDRAIETQSQPPQNSLFPTQSPFLFDPIFVSPSLDGTDQPLVKIAPGSIIRFNINLAHFVANAMSAEAASLGDILQHGFSVVFDYTGFSQYGIPVATYGAAAFAQARLFPFIIRVPEVTESPTGVRIVPNTAQLPWLPLMQFTDMVFQSPWTGGSLHGLSFSATPTQLSCQEGFETCSCITTPIRDDEVASLGCAGDHPDECEFDTNGGGEEEEEEEENSYQFCGCSEVTDGTLPYGPKCANHINLYYIALTHLEPGLSERPRAAPYDSFTKLRIKHQLLSVLTPGVPVNSLRLRVYSPPPTNLFQGELFGQAHSKIYVIGELDLRQFGLHTSSRFIPAVNLDNSTTKLNHLDLIFHARVDSLNNIPSPARFPTACEPGPLSTEAVLCIDALAITPITTTPAQVPMLLSTYINPATTVESDHEITPFYVKNRQSSYFTQLPPTGLTTSQFFPTTATSYKYNPLLTLSRYPVVHYYSQNATNAAQYQLKMTIVVGGMGGFSFQFPASAPITPSTLPAPWFGSLLQQYQLSSGALITQGPIMPYRQGVEMTYTLHAPAEATAVTVGSTPSVSLTTTACSITGVSRLKLTPTYSPSDVVLNPECIPNSPEPQQIRHFSTIQSLGANDASHTFSEAILVELTFSVNLSAITNSGQAKAIFCTDPTCFALHDFTKRILQFEIKEIFTSSLSVQIQEFVLGSVQISISSQSLLTVTGLLVPAAYVDPSSLVSLQDRADSFTREVQAGHHSLIGTVFTTSKLNFYALPSVDYSTFVPFKGAATRGLTGLTASTDLPSATLAGMVASTVTVEVDTTSQTFHIPSQTYLDISTFLETASTHQVSFIYAHILTPTAFTAEEFQYFPPTRAITVESCTPPSFGPSCSYTLAHTEPLSEYPANHVFTMQFINDSAWEGLLDVVWSLTLNDATIGRTSSEIPVGSNFQLGLAQLLGEHTIDKSGSYNLILQFSLPDDASTIFFHTAISSMTITDATNCYNFGTATTSYNAADGCVCATGYVGPTCGTKATVVEDSYCGLNGSTALVKFTLESEQSSTADVPDFYQVADVSYPFPTLHNGVYTLTPTANSFPSTLRFKYTETTPQHVDTLTDILTASPSPCCTASLESDQFFISPACLVMTRPFPADAIIRAGLTLTPTGFNDVDYSALLVVHNGPEETQDLYNDTSIPDSAVGTEFTNVNSASGVLPSGATYFYRPVDVRLTHRGSGDVIVYTYRLVTHCTYLASRETICNQSNTASCSLTECICKPGFFGPTCDNSGPALTVALQERDIFAQWTQPNPPFEPNSFHIFKLYPYSSTKPTPSTQFLAILPIASQSTMRAGSQSPVDISGAVFVPSNASHILLTIPKHVEILATGFTVVMERVGDSTSSSSSLFATHFFTAGQRIASQLCSEDSNNCAAVSTCPYECPSGFSKNSATCACECTTEQCRTYSRSSILHFNLEAPLKALIEQDGMDYLAALRSDLAAQLLLNPFPTNQTAAQYYLQTPSRTEPEPIAYSSSPSNNAAIGIERVTVLPIHPQPLQHDLSSVIITITIDPFEIAYAAEQAQARFQQLDLMLSDFNTFITPYLEGFNYLTTAARVPLTAYPASATPFKPLCQSPIHAQSAQFAPTTCPPISQLISPLWSKCSASNNTKQFIFPVCVDLAGNAFLSQHAITAGSQLTPRPSFSGLKTATWCDSRIANYPSTFNLSADSCSKKTYDTPPSITNLAISKLSIKPLDGFTLTWTFPKDADPLTTVNIYLSNPTMTYRQTLLLNQIAKSATVTMKLPRRIPPHPESVITLQINQLATSTASTQVAVTELNLCPPDLTNYCQPNAACQKLTGECACNAGYAFDAQDLGTLGFNTKTATCSLNCPNNCHNAEARGYCVLTTALSPLPSCQCNEGWTGTSCERRASCTSLEESLCASHGYVQFDPSSPTTCSDACQCNGNWGTLETDSVQCSRCTLLPAHGGQCNATGTDESATTSGNCAKCVCKKGYSGEHCSIATFYGTVQFASDSATNKLNILSVSPLSIDSALATLQTTQHGDGLDFVSEEGRQVLSQDLALSLGLPTSLVSTSRIAKSQPSSPSSLIALQTARSTTNVTFAVASNADDSDQAFNMNDLYNQWAGLQNPQTFPETPIGQSEASKEAGNPVGAEAAYDPNCDTTVQGSACPGGFDPFADPSNPIAESKGQSNSRIGITVGVVVAVVVVVAAVFILAICLARHGKRHRKWCWKPTKDDANAHLELTIDTSRAINTTTHQDDLKSTTKQSKSNSRRSAKSVTESSPFSSGTATSIDLVDITQPSDQLPPDWKKMQHVHTQQILYVNQDKMISQKHHPNSKETSPNGFSFA